MRNNNDEKEYLEKICPFLDISDNINKYINSIKNKFKTLNFKFPQDSSDNIIKNLEEIGKNIKKFLDNEDEIDSFAEKLFKFSEDIRKSSYEQESINEIRKNNNNLKDLISQIYSFKINLNNSSNIFDNIENIKKNFSKNFSYVDQSRTNIAEDDYKISLNCCNYNCGNPVKYYCKNHCYKYFCNSCKNLFDKDLYSHEFEEIDEEKEKNKIVFLNSFLYLFKIYCHGADIIFRKNNENLVYPVLDNINALNLNFNPQINFLKCIHEFYKNENDNINYRNGICEPLKNSLIKLFGLNINLYENMNNIFDDEKLRIGNNNNRNNNINNIREIYSKMIYQNKQINFTNIDYLSDFKNVSQHLIQEVNISKDRFDFKYNFIIPNLNIKKYGKPNSPYLWFGIGLKYEEIFKINIDKNNSNIPKANAFYGFKNIESDEIKKRLYYIIIKKDLRSNPNISNDNKVKDINAGLCLYLYHNIEIAEQETGIIYFGNKKYKIILMTRILPNKRRIFNDTWIVKSNEIEFISILFKEIIT